MSWGHGAEWYVRHRLVQPDAVRVIGKVKGANLATTIGEGNYATRNFRQKPIVGLQTFTHKPNPNRVNKAKQVITPVITTKKVLSKSMAKARTTKRTVKKYTKRRVPRRKLPPLAIPRSKVVRFRLSTRGGLAGTSGAIGTLMLKMNSLNDPTGAIGAALPLSLDQWAGMYTKYIVLGSQAKIKFIANALTSPGMVGIHLDDNNTALTTVDHYKELPHTVARILTTQKDMVTLSMKYSGKKFWHLNDIKDDSEQEATFGTSPGDPTDIAYAHLFAEDLLGTDTFTTEFLLEMEFIVLLTNPVTMAQSSL